VEINEQVRELQAQEFASGFVGAMSGGEVNQYADTYAILSSLLHALRFSVICDPIIISFNYDIFF
jgi:hypothetical protein